MKKELTQEYITQNLKDAGCDGETIHCFMECFKSKNAKKQERILYGHRKELLHKVHEGQKCIDCLDYLTYQMKMESSNKKDK